VGYDVVFDPDGIVETYVTEPGIKIMCCSKIMPEPFVPAQGSNGISGFHPAQQIAYLYPLSKNQAGDLWPRELVAALRQKGLKDSFSYHYSRNEFAIEDWTLTRLSGNTGGRSRQRTTNSGPSVHVHPQAAAALLAEQSRPEPSRLQATGENAPLPKSHLFRPGSSDFESSLSAGYVGRYREPAELLRRTPETESLLEAEPFVRAELDTESSRPLLVLLGVRDTPTGPDRLLDRLRALAGLAKPPIQDVEKWYHRLDRLIEKCSTDDLQKVKDAFHHEQIILAEGGGWVRAAEVFLDAVRRMFQARLSSIPPSAAWRSGLRSVSPNVRLWN